MRRPPVAGVRIAGPSRVRRWLELTPSTSEPPPQLVELLGLAVELVLKVGQLETRVSVGNCSGTVGVDTYLAAGVRGGGLRAALPCHEGLFRAFAS